MNFLFRYTIRFMRFGDVFHEIVRVYHIRVSGVRVVAWDGPHLFFQAVQRIFYMYSIRLYL